MPYPAAKICIEGFQKVFNVWTESHFISFEAEWRIFPWSQNCLSLVLKQINRRNRHLVKQAVAKGNEKKHPCKRNLFL